MGLAEVRYKVVGMTCQSCAVSVETMLQSIEGVEKAQVDFAAQEVWVRHDPEKAPLAKLQSTLAPAGYVLLGDAAALR
jgi:copper chaperone CopZ